MCILYRYTGMKSIFLCMRRVVTKEHQCWETVNIEKQFNDLCGNFCKQKIVCGGCTDNIVFFYIQLINNHILYMLHYAVI